MPGGVQEGKTGFYFLPILHICHSCGNIDKFKEWFHPLYWKFSHVTCYGNKTNDHGYDLLAQSVQWITSRFVCGGKFLRHCPFHSLDLFSPVLFQSTSRGSFDQCLQKNILILFTSSFRLKIEQILTVLFSQIIFGGRFMLHFAISKVRYTYTGITCVQLLQGLQLLYKSLVLIFQHRHPEYFSDILKAVKTSLLRSQDTFKMLLLREFLQSFLLRQIFFKGSLIYYVIIKVRENFM